MKGLAWDDNREDMEPLVKRLERHGVFVELTDDVDDFNARLGAESWDLILTDLVNAKTGVRGEEDPHAGLRAIYQANTYAKDAVIFLITHHMNVIGQGHVPLPPNVIAKSKSTYPEWLAMDIIHELRRQGVFVDRKRVFLIYGHDRKADGATGAVESYLSKHGVRVEKVAGANLTTELAAGLIDKMHRCAAILAICTPDDPAPMDGQRQPRQNVLLEVGMAMGLHRGLKRLVLLQKWGADDSERAYLPTDLSGVVTLRFATNVENAFNDLDAKLIALGVDIKSVR